MTKTADCKGCKWEKIIPEAYRIRGTNKTDKFVINHSIQPKVFGHMVVMFKAHKDKDITKINDYKNCLDIAYKIAKILKNKVEEISGLRVERVYLATFNEDDEWHPHVHIIPRSVGVIKEMRGPKIFNLQSPDSINLTSDL